MLAVLTSLDPAPESVPINCLMAMPGTPLEDQPPVDIFDLVRLIATTRLALPNARVRLSAGRTRLSPEGQALCFFAGSQLGVLRRQAAHGGEPRRAGGPGAACARSTCARSTLPVRADALLPKIIVPALLARNPLTFSLPGSRHTAPAHEKAPPHSCFATC